MNSWAGPARSSRDLLNLTNEELGNQLQHLADTGDFMSRDALDAAKEYSGGMDRLKSSLSSVSTFIGTVLIKDLNKWIGRDQKDNRRHQTARQMAGDHEKGH